MSGGSELRASECANAISSYTPHQSFLLAEKKIPERIESYINSSVTIIKDIFSPESPKIDIFYEMDAILIINTDSKAFCTSDYWLGKSEKHGIEVDLRKIKKMIFLFNFLISPSRHLYTIERYCKDIRIITTNTKFFEEVSSQDRYELVRHMPRTILQSPINPHLYDQKKIESETIRFGAHSKNPENKWNEDWPKLIEKCRKRLGEKITFDLMGINSKRAAEIQKKDELTIIRKENEISVREYLNGIDVFTFFPSFSREEPWCRVIGEAMMSGCPVIATNSKGGNRDQVIPGNNGFLSKSTDNFFTKIVFFCENPDKIKQMGRNSLLLAKNFTSEKIITKFIEFIEN